MMAVSEAQKPTLPGMIETADDGDRPSITEVNGTVAHFEMAYNPNPNDRFVFGPPIMQRLPSLVFVGFAAAVGIATALAQNASMNPSLHKFIVTEGRMPLVIIICFAAVATFIRSGLRGVIVTSDSIETRQLSMGFPRVRRYRWAQIDRIVLDKDSVLFELWNGEYERLPKVQKGEELVDLLERVAHARGRQVTRLDRKAK